MSNLKKTAKEYQEKLAQAQYQPVMDNMGNAQNPNFKAIIDNIEKIESFQNSLFQAIVQLRKEIGTYRVE